MRFRTTLRSRRGRVLGALTLVAAGVATLVASAYGGSSTLYAQAVAALKHDEALPKIAVTVPSAKPFPKGKSAVYINCGAPACGVLADGAASASKVLGWSYHTLATTGTPSSVQAAWQTAVQQKPSVVYTSGFNRSVFNTQLLALKGLGIPVIDYATTDPPGNGITLMMGPPNEVGAEGQQLADFIAADSHNNANTLLVYVPAYAILASVTTAFNAQYHKLCPGCALASMDLAATAIGTTAVQQVVTYLRANPKVNYVAFTLDGAAIGLPAALKAAGLSNKVKFLGASPSVENLGYVAAGEEAATVNQDYYGEMYEMADAAGRTFLHEKVAGVDPTTIQYWVETKSNLISSTGFGPVVPNMIAKYKKLWGVK